MKYGQIILGSAVIVLFLALYAAIGEQDYKMQKAQEYYACAMVAAGAWPEGYLRANHIQCSRTTER